MMLLIVFMVTASAECRGVNIHAKLIIISQSPKKLLSKSFRRVYKHRKLLLHKSVHVHVRARQFANY
jgi:hypothetical protein